MSFRPLLVAEALLACMAVVQFCFSNAFLEPAQDLDKLIADTYEYRHNPSYYSVVNMVPWNQHVPPMLAVAALAVELLRRLLMCQAGTQQATASDHDYVPAEGRPTAPFEKGCDGDGIGVKADPEPVDSHPLTVVVAQDSDSRGLTDNTHCDGQRQHYCYAVGYVLGIVAYLFVTLIVIWLCFMVWHNYGVDRDFLTEGCSQRLGRIWRDAADCGHNRTCSQPLCDFMEMYHCSGSSGLCPYLNVFLPAAPVDPVGGTCPVCDFTTRRSPLVVKGTCNSLISYRGYNDQLSCAVTSSLTVLILTIVWVWVLVRSVCACFCARR